MASSDHQTWEKTLTSLRAPLYRRDRVSTGARAVIDVLLDLEAEGQTAEATTLIEAFRAHLDETGRKVPDGQLERWTGLKAIRSESLAVPADLRKHIAVSMLDEHSNNAARAAMRLRQQDPVEARRVARGLRELAPALARALDEQLDPAQLSRPRSPVVLLAAALLAVCVVSGGWLAWANLLAPAPPVAPRSYEERIVRVRAASVRGTAYAQRIGRQDILLDTLQLVDELEARQCDRARDTSMALRARLSHLGQGDDGLRSLHDVADHADAICSTGR